MIKHVRSSIRGGLTRKVSNNMTSLITRFLSDESAATAIEYGLIAAGISVAIITAVMTLGTQLNSTFNAVSSQLASAGK
jgi:pilus assembly protein Flp/PilA